MKDMHQNQLLRYYKIALRLGFTKSQIRNQRCQALLIPINLYQGRKLA